ncbi:M15 family metallopeptidase [Streptomyces sp. HUAS ZL42]|uniref:M15 family metallopeptidase n=1 Tax=Streptomyces sp. HUAS ZL42 TaxID=3231715 RepID=UPI00345F0742
MARQQLHEHLEEKEQGARQDQCESRAPAEFVALSDVAPSIIQEIRYAGHHNFVGRPVRGYSQPICVLTRPAAEALGRAQEALLKRGYTLKIYDGYRPQRAVDDFLDWVRRPADDRMRREFYPRIDKSRLFADGYIAERSGHSRGSTVDVTLVRLPACEQRPYVPGELLTPSYAPHGRRFPDNSLDMGTGYDCFDTLAHTANPRIAAEARANRRFLKRTLEREGLINYEKEWWHFTLAGEPFPDTYFDFPVASTSLL